MKACKATNGQTSRCFAPPLRVPAILLLILTLLAVVDLGVAAAQSSTTGMIRGRTASSDGAAVSSVQIIARNLETGLERGALSSSDGSFLLRLLPPGQYLVEAQSVGYATTAQETGVRLGETTSVELLLSVQAVALEGIDVTVDRALQVDTRQSGVAESVSQDEISKLPTLGRDFTDFIALSGLVSPQPTVSTGGTVAIGGGRTSGVNVQIDGADANYNFFGESRGGARVPFTFSLESVREFQVIANGFDVEHGNYSSGIVNVVTRGGTNDFRGSVHGFYRGDALTADEFAHRTTLAGRDTLIGGARPDAFQVQQFGATVSGPIIRDRLHFLASYDGQRRKDPFETATSEGTGITPDSIARFIDVLEGVYGQQGAANEFGRFERTDDVDVLFGRLDWAISDDHRAVLRGNYADYRSENDAIQFGGTRARTYGSTFIDQNLSLVGELNSTLGDRTSNVLRLQYATETRPRLGNNYMPIARVTVDGTRTLEYGGNPNTFRNDPRETKLQVINNLTHQIGRHTIKLGTSNLYTHTRNEFWVNGPGEYVFDSLSAFEEARPTSFFRLVPGSGATETPSTKFGVLEASIYGQTEWQTTDRLLLTLGLRYDLTRYTDAFDEVPSIDALPGLPTDFRTGLAPRDFNNVSPRIALAYDIDGAGRHVVRSGVGRFIGRIPGVIASNVGMGADPWLAVFCFGATAPVPDYERWTREAPDGSTLPTRCEGGADPTGAGQYNFWASDFEYPETWKANIGYEGRVLPGTRLGVDLLYGRTDKNFNAIDLAMHPDPFFHLASEGGRPVFVPAESYNPASNAPATARSRYANQSVDRIFVNTSDNVADEVAATLRVDQRVGSARLRGSYTYNWAKDNSSAVCCGRMLTDDMIAGDLNDRGGRGGPEWANSAFVRPHTFVLSGEMELPLEIGLSGIFRAYSGSYYTPTVQGDLNGDGNNNNRPFIGAPEQMAFERPEDQAAYEQLLSSHACLGDAVGTIIGRNSCRNPAIQELDLSVRRTFSPGDQEVELVVDLFNVLNFVNSDWGQLRQVAGVNRRLLVARGYDAEQEKIVYRVNDGFGEETFIGPTRQFQAQLGLRVRF